MSIVEASHTVVQGKPHPLQDVMQGLLAHHQELNSAHHSVFSKAKEFKTTPTMVDAKKLREWAEQTGLFQRVRAIASEFNRGQLQVRNSVPEMELRPPRADELYGRVDPGSSVVDLGTGDSKRLIRYQGFFGKVTAIDANLVPPKKELPKHWSREERELRPNEGVPVLSFNALTQLSNESREVVEQNDGMHIAPNHAALKSVGRLVGHGPDVQAVMGGGVVYNENLLTLEDSVGKGRFYLGSNTYKESSYTIEIGASVQSNPVRGKYKRPTYPVPLNDATWKVDGVFHVLKMVQGRGLLRDRTGAGFYVKSNCESRVELHLEFKEHAVYLLRVENYRGMRVFHSISLLEKFCRRVKFEISSGGKKHFLQPPPRVENISAPPPGVDGVVLRDDDVDYVFNFHVHLDVDEGMLEHGAYDQSRLAEFLEVERGLRGIKWEGSHGKMTTCSIEEFADGSCRVCMVPRADKMKPDPVDDWNNKFLLCKVGDLLRDDAIDEEKDCVCGDDREDILE